MNKHRPSQSPRWVLLMVLGVMLNTLGIAFTSLGWPRYLLMVVGLLFLLTAVLFSLREHQQR